MSRLTIAVPTYDRNQTLAANLEVLLPQIGGRARLLVLDNASPVPVAQTLAPLLARFPEVDVTVVRHALNIGGAANVLRCIEIADSEWVWVLGDDDTPLDDAMDHIIGHLDRWRDSTFINFYGLTDLFERPRVVESSGRREFIERVDSLNNISFISTCLYRRAAMTEHLRIGFHFAYTMVPHVALVLSAFGADGHAVLSTTEILHRRNDPPSEEQYANINIALGFALLLDLPLSTNERRILAIKMRTVSRVSATPRNLFAQAVQSAVSTGDDASARYVYEQVRRRLFAHETLARRIEASVYGLLLRAPRLVSRVLGVLYPLLRGRRFDSSIAQSRFQRM